LLPQKLILIKLRIFIFKTQITLYIYIYISKSQITWFIGLLGGLGPQRKSRQIHMTKIIAINQGEIWLKIDVNCSFLPYTPCTFTLNFLSQLSTLCTSL